MKLKEEIDIMDIKHPIMYTFLFLISCLIYCWVLVMKTYNDLLLFAIAINVLSLLIGIKDYINTYQRNNLYFEGLNRFLRTQYAFFILFMIVGIEIALLNCI